MAVGTEAPPAPSLPEKTGCDGKLGHFCRQQGVVGGQPSASTPREESSSSVLGAGPTTQAMGQVGQRLMTLSLMLMGGCAVALAIDVVFYGVLGWPYRGPQELQQVEQLRLVLLIALSVGMFVVVRTKLLATRAMLNLGFAYQLAGAILISATTFICPESMHHDQSTLTWLGIWIVLFPLVVPAPLTRTALVALACAATAPISFVLWSWGQPLDGQLIATTATPYVVCVGLALAPAYLLQRMNRDLREVQDQARELGTYELVERLGKGGMGEVWRAQHRLLTRAAAIKTIHVESMLRKGGDPKALIARFEREAQSTASLSSVHTIDIYDFGATDAGTLYYVMELLEGTDLESLVERFGPLPPARVAHLLSQVCDSLAEAHARGMVHRDVKPANIYVCRMGLQYDFVKVLDFGLVALPTWEELGDGPKLTGEGTILGTPAYMSPEQAEGHGEVDGRGDLYALGCVAYWLLTGELVFDEPSPMRMLIEHIKTPPVDVRERANQPIPDGFADAIMSLLAKDPDDRPSSAAEFGRRLRACSEINTWDRDQAAAWWEEHLPQLTVLPSEQPTTAWSPGDPIQGTPEPA